jgi:spermidine/putrescine transport system substrate-binding protein
MTFHPKARRSPGQGLLQGLDRRSFLRGTLGVSAGVAGLAALSACGNGDGTPTFDTGVIANAPYELARPDHPVKQPISSDNPPIADGLAPEKGGTFRMLNYADYVNPAVIKAFEAKYDVQLQLTPFNNYDEMLQKLRQPNVYFDIVFPGPSVLGKMVYAQLIQPLNHSYFDHFQNVYKSYYSPWYDVDAQYTVPYTVYSTGIGYRRDRVDQVPDNGYDLLWDTKYKGSAYILDDRGEAIAMSLLRNGLTNDINTGDATLINKATDSLIELINTMNIKVGIQDYVYIPSGQATIHQAWSGDMLGALQYLAKGQSSSILGYWAPQKDLVVGSDVIAVPKSSKKPVLAHLFMDYLMSPDGAMTNFSWTGYQPPVQSITPQGLINDGLVPDNLTNAVLTDETFAKGLVFYETSPAIDQLWQSAWSRFQAGG